MKEVLLNAFVIVALGFGLLIGISTLANPSEAAPTPALCLDFGCLFSDYNPKSPPPTAAICLAAGPAGTCTPIGAATACACAANPVWGVPTSGGTSWVYCYCEAS
jgi:hypothetical protein